MNDDLWRGSAGREHAVGVRARLAVEQDLRRAAFVDDEPVVAACARQTQHFHARIGHVFIGQVHLVGVDVEFVDARRAGQRQLVERAAGVVQHHRVESSRLDDELVGAQPAVEPCDTANYPAGDADAVATGAAGDVRVQHVGQRHRAAVAGRQRTRGQRPVGVGGGREQVGTSAAIDAEATRDERELRDAADEQSARNVGSHRGRLQIGGVDVDGVVAAASLQLELAEAEGVQAAAADGDRVGR